MSSFITTILHPTTHEPIQVRVAYNMSDCGTLMRRNEDVRAVLEEVFQPGVPSTRPNLLEQLDEDTLRLVRAQAESHNQDEIDVARFDGEHI